MIFSIKIDHDKDIDYVLPECININLTPVLLACKSLIYCDYQHIVFNKM